MRAPVGANKLYSAQLKSSQLSNLSPHSHDGLPSNATATSARKNIFISKSSLYLNSK